MLKKSTRFLLLVFSFAIFEKSIAQSDTLKWTPDVRLKFGDFLVENKAGLAYIDVAIHYSYAFQRSTFGKFYPIVTSYAVLNRKTSSLPDSTLGALRYAQLFFDLEGYHARLLKARALELGELRVSGESAKAKMDSIFFKSGQEIAQLKKNLNKDLGAKNEEEVISAWERRVSELIKSTPDIQVEDRIGKWQIGIFIGIGRSFFSDKTKQYFSDATGLNYGFEADVKKSRFALDVNLNFNKAKQGFEKEGIWQSGMKTHFAGVEVSYGRKLVRSKWLIVPYAGLSVNSFTPAKTEKNDKRDVTGYSPVLGVEINRNFKFLDAADEKVFFFYKCKLSVNPSNLIKNYAGTQVNLKLAVGFDVSRVRKRMVGK